MVVKDVVGVDPGSGQASINSAGKCMQIMWFSMQAGRAAHYHTDGSMAQYGSLLLVLSVSWIKARQTSPGVNQWDEAMRSHPLLVA